MRRSTLLVAASLALAGARPAFAEDARSGAATTPAAPTPGNPGEAAPAAPEPGPVPTAPDAQAPVDGAPDSTAAPEPESRPPTPARIRLPRELEGDADEVTPAARDTVGGHLAVGAHAGLLVPFGELQAGTSQSARLDPGLAVGGDITYGISRTVMIGAYGQVGLPAARGAWSGADVSTIAAGPLLRYHLVQGTRFDPWLSVSLGFRRTSNGADSFTGIDVARFQVGGDWYAASNLGFGPLLELSLGTFVDSTEPSGDRALNAHFLLGGRIVFDSPGK